MNDPQYLYDIDYELYVEREGTISTVLLGMVLIAGDAAEAIRQVDACARDMADTAQLPYRGHKVINAACFVHEENGQEKFSVIGRSYLKSKPV